MRLIVRLPIVMIIYSFLGFLALSYHYQCTFRKRSFYGSFIFFLFILSEGIAILFLPSYNPSIFNYSFEYSLYASIISDLLNLVVILIIAIFRKYRPQIDMEVSVKWAVVYIPVFSIFTLLLVYEAANIPVFLKLISIALTLFLNVMIYYLYNRLTAFYNESAKAKELQHQTEFYEHEMKLMQNKFGHLNLLKHDIKNHLSVLQGLLKEEKIEVSSQYLEEIASVIASNEAIARSGNIVIDSLLNFKDYEFRQNNIKLELFLKIPQEIDLPAFELAAVFGNLVDNAIEDCKTVDGERVIVVRVLQKRGVLQMSVKNTFDGIIKIEDGKMLSRKRNYRERGAGLDRVSEIVDRYNGLLEYETVDAAFSVRLIIYLLH